MNQPSMTRRSLVAVAFAVMSIIGAGCGAASTEEAALPSAQSGVEPAASGAERSLPAGEGETEFIGRKCRATCDVTGPAGVCPSKVEEVRSSFLGGCNRACTNAQNAATGGLSPSCTVVACRTTCPAG